MRFGVGRWAFVRWLSVRKWSLLLCVVAFLFGRAAIFSELSPFAVAFAAAVYFHRRDLFRWTNLCSAAGAALGGWAHAAAVWAELAVLILLQKGLERYERSDPAYGPVMAASAVLAVRTFAETIGEGFGWLSLLWVGVETALGFVLTVIFLQAMPIFVLRKSWLLRNEEIVCLMLLLASSMTGTVGWEVGGVSAEHVLSRYFTLLFGFVGGASLGASAGVVTGLVLSLADGTDVVQISLLAFAGLLAGLVREGGKTATAVGMALGASILSFYAGDGEAAVRSSWDTATAVTLFMLTPSSVVRMMARYVPGTVEHHRSQHEYVRRAREMTAKRVRRFAELFRQLSGSFRQDVAGRAVAGWDAGVGPFLDEVAERVCRTCHRKEWCWERHFSETERFVRDVVGAVVERESDPSTRTGRGIRPEWRKACVRPEKVWDVVLERLRWQRFSGYWKKQLADGRQLVADQLAGVSQVMDDLARRLLREGWEMFVQEERIRQALEDLGLSIVHVDIVSLEPGNIEIEITRTDTGVSDECRKIVAPMLTDFLGEPIAVRRESRSDDGQGYCTAVFGSAREYVVETGVAAAAKGGELLSGDCYSVAELDNGKFAVAISDGMGNGERAREESSAALSILQQLLQAGLDERLAIQSVNAVLALRSPDESYATVDLALIDLHDAETTFLKIGSAPSFIKRGEEVMRVAAHNPPVGILQNIDVDLVGMRLKPGDLLIMMSDGLYDASGDGAGKDAWIRRAIREIRTDDPQEIADCLLEQAIRYRQGVIADDMTVVVAKIRTHRTEWATFRWPGFARMERPKTVS